jgi:hypothetical protein
MAFAEDLAPFFQAAEFADAATLAGLPVRGIFDRAYAQAEVGFAGMASTQPAFTLASASVPAGVVGAALVHKGTAYAVVDPQPDGTGVSVLFLELA